MVTLIPLFFFLFSILLPQSFSTQSEPHKTYIFCINAQSKSAIFPTLPLVHLHLRPTTPQILHTYSTVFHGFSATLSASHAASLLSHPSVLASFEDRAFQLHTTQSPQFLGLCNQRGLWSDSDYGFDVIVAFLDTGIWPEHRSFFDLNLGPIPARWKVVCESLERER